MVLRRFKLRYVAGLLLLVLGGVTAAGLFREAKAVPAGGTISACVSVITGHTHILYPGQPPNCGTAEYLVQWNGEGVAGPPGPPGPTGAPGATNVVRRVSSLQFADPGGSETVSVECLEGEQVTGGGYITGEDPTELLPILLESDVSDAGNGWKVTIFNLASVADGMGIQAVAMCASP